MLSAHATKIIVLLHKVQQAHPTDCYLLLERGGAICAENNDPLLLEGSES